MKYSVQYTCIYLEDGRIWYKTNQLVRHSEKVLRVTIFITHFGFLSSMTPKFVGIETIRRISHHRPIILVIHLFIMIWTPSFGIGKRAGTTLSPHLSEQEEEVFGGTTAQRTLLGLIIGVLNHWVINVLGWIQEAVPVGIVKVYFLVIRVFFFAVSAIFSYLGFKDMSDLGFLFLYYIYELLYCTCLE